MKHAILFPVLVCLLAPLAKGGPFEPDPDTYADLLKDPRKARILEYWFAVHALPKPPLIGNPEERRKMEWLVDNLDELPPVLVEIVRRERLGQPRAYAAGWCTNACGQPAPMLRLIRRKLPEWFAELPYDRPGNNTNFMRSCFGALADFGDEGDLALLGTLAANKDPEKAAWAEIAADRLAFLRKRLAKEDRARKSSRDAGPSPRKPPPSHRTPAPEPTPSAPAWKTPVAAAAAALLLAAVLLALRSKAGRNP